MQKILYCTIFLFLNTYLYGQVKKIGIFDQAIDIGNVVTKGTSKFNNGIYTISGSGINIWGKKDEFHFLHRGIKGDFIATSNPSLKGKGTDPHRKTGWMIRTSQDTSAAFVSLTVHADGLTAFQYRKVAGTNIEEVKCPIIAPDVLQIERRGRSYIVSITKSGNPFWSVEIPDFNFPESVLLGLFVCSHNPEEVEEATHSQVRIFGALE
jgi:TolB protein